MKSLWLLILGAAVILTWHVAYDRGQREMQQFQALCETPGVECVVRFKPEYLERHPSFVIPADTVGEIADSDGRVW